MSLIPRLRELIVPTAEAATAVLWLIVALAALVAIYGGPKARIALAAWLALP